MTPDVQAALDLWGMPKAQVQFVAGRENQVYRVTQGGARYALRFKRPGYRSRAELVSELDWLAAMDRAGLNVPVPRASVNGALLESTGGHMVDLVSWLDGTPIGQTGTPLALDDATGVFAAMGAEMARLHAACDAWTPPPGFTRARWDAEGLLGTDPVWGRFWQNPTLDPETRDLFDRFRAEARQCLDGLDLDCGLIHADFVRENVLIDGSSIRLIDFDDGGCGYRLFDLATALIKNLAEPKFGALKEALIRGYLSVRPLDLTHLDLFLTLRATTYVGWVMSRMAEPGAERRNTRFIRDARTLCAAYLG